MAELKAVNLESTSAFSASEAAPSAIAVLIELNRFVVAVLRAVFAELRFVFGSPDK